MREAGLYSGGLKKLNEKFFPVFPSGSMERLNLGAKQHSTKMTTINTTRKEIGKKYFLMMPHRRAHLGLL